jgi:hypothetical protein
VSNELIVLQLDDHVIAQRPVDGYIDATAMCQACGKRWNNYWRSQETQEFLAELSGNKGLPITRNRAVNNQALVESYEGRYGGTWVHPNVAIHLAQWCSPRFAVLVTDWVQHWLTTGPLQPRLPVFVRRLAAAFDVGMQAPEGYWTVFELSSNLLIKVECEWKYPVDRFDLLDGSVGSRWSRYRQRQSWASADVRQYTHVFPDHRGCRPARAYRYAELPHFKAWLDTVYVPIHLPEYLRTKYPGHRLPGPVAASVE